MQKTESKKKEQKLYLCTGKGVKLFFDDNHYLSRIRLSVNKVTEIIGNGLADEESLQNIKRIVLITKINYKTTVIVDGHLVDNNQTVYQKGYFEFHVHPSKKLHREKLFFIMKKRHPSK